MTENRFITELTKVFTERRAQFVRFACSYVRDNDEAEDIVMNAFTHVLDRRDQLKTDSNIPALLLTSIKNLSLNYLQHQEVRLRAEQTISDWRQRELALRISSLESCNPDKLFCDEIQTLLRDAFKHLSPTDRKIFMMSRMEHCTNKEIATRLDLSVKAVEYHISRSLKQLRTQLKDYRFLLLLFT